MANYGRLVIDLGYVVDLNNQDMINESRSCFMEDIHSLQKYEELSDHIKLIEDNNVTDSDIPDHIKEILKITE